MTDRLSMSSRNGSFLPLARVPWWTPVALLLTAGALLAGCDVFGGGDSTPPDAPSNLSSTAESESVALEWSAPQDDDLAGYNVYRASGTSIDVNSDTPLNEDTLVPDPSYTDESPENGTTYRYRITAVDDSDNESAPSDSTRVTPFPDPPPHPSN